MSHADEPPLELEETEPEDPLEQQAAQVRSEAPGMPWTITMSSAVFHITPIPSGGAVLHFTVAAPTPQGIALMPPRVDVPMSAEAWEVFKRAVASDGASSRSAIQIARGMPPVTPIPRR